MADLSTSRNLLFAFLNLCPTWVQVILKNPSIRLVPDLGINEIPEPHLLTSWRAFYFPTNCREVALQLQTNLIRSDTKKYKLASMAKWYHFVTFTDFSLEQSTQKYLSGQTSLKPFEQYL